MMLQTPGRSEQIKHPIRCSFVHIKSTASLFSDIVAAKDLILKPDGSAHSKLLSKLCDCRRQSAMVVPEFSTHLPEFWSMIKQEFPTADNSPDKIFQHDPAFVGWC
jgi:hypothetical protein